MFSKFGKVAEYVPFMLITFLFVAEAEMGNKIKGTTCNLLIGLVLMVVMYALLVFIKLPKVAVIIIAVILWCGFIFLKKVALTPSIKTPQLL